MEKKERKESQRIVWNVTWDPRSETMRGGMLRDLIIELLAIFWVRRALGVAGGKIK